MLAPLVGIWAGCKWYFCATDTLWTRKPLCLQT